MVRPELITTKALSVLGASQYSAREVRQYLDLLAAHPEVWGAVDKVCTHTFTVGEANEAILKQQMSDSVKILLVPEK